MEKTIIIGLGILLYFSVLSFNHVTAQNLNNFLNDSLYSYSWNSNLNAWTEEEKGVNKYDEFGNKIEHIYYEWSTFYNLWVPHHKYNYSYSPSGKILESLSYNGGIQGVWAITNKMVYLYDTKDSLYENIYYTMFNNWVPLYKSELLYNTEGYNDTVLEYRYDRENEKWEYSGMNSYGYDTNGNMTEKIYCFWFSSDSVFYPYFKESFVYDSDNYLIDYSYYSRYNDSVWSNDGRMKYNYNENGLLSEINHFYWNETENDWILNSKNIFAYNTEQFINEETYMNWNSELLQWENLSQSIYTYDENNNQIDLTKSKWQTEATNWIYIHRNHYYWSLPSEIKELKLVYDVKIFPNPTSGLVTVNSSGITNTNFKVELINTKGQMVYCNNKDFQSVFNIDFSCIKNGLYILKLTNNENIITKEIFINNQNN